MEPNTLIEQIFSRFTIESMKLRSIRISSRNINEVTHLEILEVPNVPEGTQPTVTREYSLPMTLEAMSTAKLLVSLVEMETRLIKASVSNVTNFKTLGVFDSEMINQKLTTHIVTDELDIFKNYLTYSMEFILKNVLTKGSDKTFYTLMEVEKEPKFTSRAVHKKFTRTLNYAGKDFEIVPENIQVNFSVAEVGAKLSIMYLNDGVATPVVNLPILFEIDNEIQSVSQMNLVTQGTIIDRDEIDAFINSMDNGIEMDTQERTMEVKDFPKECYSGVEEVISTTIVFPEAIYSSIDAEVLEINIIGEDGLLEPALGIECVVTKGNKKNELTLSVNLNKDVCVTDLVEYEIVVVSSYVGLIKKISLFTDLSNTPTPLVKK